MKVAKRAGGVVGKGSKIAKAKAAEYKVGENLENVKKKAFEAAGVNPMVGNIAVKVGSTAVGIGLVTAALPSVAIGGAVALGAYCVGKEKAPETTDKVMKGVKKVGSAAIDVTAEFNKGYKEEQKDKEEQKE